MQTTRSKCSSRIAQAALLLALAALAAACNVGVGLSAAMPAPWGEVTVEAGTDFPSHPRW